MKGKIKKVIAGIALGIAGSFVLAGCSNTQQAAIDRLVDSSDKLITNIESVLDYQKNEITKEEVVEQLFLARKSLSFGFYDNMKLTIDCTSYTGLFVTPSNSNTISYEYYYRNNDSNKTIAEVVNDKTSILKHDVVTGKCVSYSSSNNTKKEVEYNYLDWNLSLKFDIFPGFMVDSINVNNIKNVSYNDGIYTCELFVKLYQIAGDEIAIINVFDTLKLQDNKILSVDMKTVTESYPEEAFLKDESDEYILDEYGVPKFSNKEAIDLSKIEVFSNKYKLTYEYENIDYSGVDNIIASIDN